MAVHDTSTHTRSASSQDWRGDVADARSEIEMLTLPLDQTRQVQNRAQTTAGQASQQTRLGAPHEVEFEARR